MNINKDSIISRIGLVALSLGAVLTIVELDHVRPRVAEAHKVLSAIEQHSKHGDHTNQGGAGDHGMHMRKDKEEIRHTTHSYGVMMRSHPTAGTA